jgi:hypothetical protein
VQEAMNETNGSVQLLAEVNLYHYHYTTTTTTTVKTQYTGMTGNITVAFKQL